MAAHGNRRMRLAGPWTAAATPPRLAPGGAARSAPGAAPGRNCRRGSARPAVPAPGAGALRPAAARRGPARRIRRSGRRRGRAGIGPPPALLSPVRWAPRRSVSAVAGPSCTRAIMLQPDVLAWPEPPAFARPLGRIKFIAPSPAADSGNLNLTLLIQAYVTQRSNGGARSVRNRPGMQSGVPRATSRGREEIGPRESIGTY